MSRHLSIEPIHTPFFPRKLFPLCTPHLAIQMKYVSSAFQDIRHQQGGSVIPEGQGEPVIAQRAAWTDSRLGAGMGTQAKWSLQELRWGWEAMEARQPENAGRVNPTERLTEASLSPRSCAINVCTSGCCPVTGLTCNHPHTRGRCLELTQARAGNPQKSGGNGRSSGGFCLSAGEINFRLSVTLVLPNKA